MSKIETAFEAFNLPISIQLEMETLDQAYRSAQAQVHPDRFIGKTPMEQRIAATQAMALNDAYHRLKSPLLRAQEILKSRGLPIPGDKGQTVQHPTLLMEIMDLRDRLENGRSKGDMGGLKQELMASLQEIETTFDTLSDEEIPLAYLRFIYLTKLMEDAGE